MVSRMYCKTEWNVESRMMDNNIAVSIRNLNKTYKLYASPAERFVSLLFKKNLGRDFVALDNISVDIKRGEAFAIVGKNGSGKSTMLQILAGILKPTAGEVQVNGRIAALLELGSGFNPESTGYENIYMNAAILGLSKQEIEKKVQDIIAFADIGEHLYEPVKTYSSGMYVRLGFAVAINVDADVLLVDEALAVGDVFFRQKCYSRLNELKARGTTIILVTHNMSEVEQFCDRGMLLKNGKQITVDKSQIVVKEYYMTEENDKYKQEKVSEEEKVEVVKQERKEAPVVFQSGWSIKEESFFDLSLSKEISNGFGAFVKIGLFDKEGKARRVFFQGEYGYFYAEASIKKNIQIPLLGIILYNQMNIIVHGKDTSQTYTKLPEYVESSKRIIFLQKIKFDMAEGEYSFEAGFSHIDIDTYRNRAYLIQEAINEGVERLCVRNNVGSFSVIPRKVGDPTKIVFHGSCDLPGETELVIQN